MSNSYGYYLPLSEDMFDAVRFLGVEPKKDGVGEQASQKIDRDGTPIWTLSALVKFEGGSPQTETFTWTATQSTAYEVAAIPELTAIKLVGLRGGKWSRSGSDRTDWSFAIDGLDVL
jgi:hypothetical protein